MSVYTKNERIAQIIINIFFITLCLLVVLPFLLLFLSSITDESTLIINGYSFFPKKFSLDAYKYIFRSGASLVRALGISLLITAAGTAGSLLITPMLAYPLSRSEFKYRGLVTFLIFFTMLFNGGMVSSYVMWTRYLNVKNTIWALLLPNLLMSGFNVILVKNFFVSNIPGELIESARIDGAGENKIYFSIVLPLAKAIMATIGLFTAIGYWNDWTNGLYYITKRTDLFSLQNYLNRILQDIQYLSSAANKASTYTTNMTMPTTSVRMALAVVGVIPIMALYPFFQKYFVKGIIIGAVKG